MRVPRWLTVVLLGTALLASACSGGSASGGTRHTKHAHAAAPTTSARPSPSPKGPPRLAPARYRRKLASADRPISQALATIRDARSMASLRAHLLRAERRTSHAVRVLEPQLPPRRVDAEHDDFVAALRALDTDLTGLIRSVDGKQLCASSSVLSHFGGERSDRTVPAAARALQRKGFPTGLRLPSTPPRQDRRPGTGTFTRNGSRTGLGKLQIQNNGSTDAVVSLVVGHAPIFAVFVRAGAGFTVTGINDGTYEAYFRTGHDWDSASNSFTRSCSYTKYDDTFPFTTTSTTSAVWTITLEKVIGGNASTSEVDPNKYPGG